ncbi:3-methylcrotonoyl-CoA carboxylase, alpha subunit [Cognatiyoonia koreensis]|uniref:3-methylcrotonoyl-CoA carboxylase, alpha subunit n=1 Tax=Cognatiyoonia koreensis TaxID=364200 RepID=A0A1I0NJS8_9RHOB|nr:biotin carboxylase N-terminal domain-containing protein [Cognatiyoonia koreensis]SEW01646.1 3-methylcrotonoyl-CoA carboxylase, alpha subunit [Cognatiyoonia koreensis]
MFTKILIANRGEIAVRIAKTARALGVQTVAVYSDADADALHVRSCDEAVRLGPAPVADSYLRGDLIIAAARQTGAQAIHPGYGFLSENPNFVDEVEKSGLTFIGPSADAIRKMGLKDAAKALMEKAGVPVVPGYHGKNQDAGHLAKEAEQIGYPVLIKAVAGGGGKGMRLVERAADFAENLASAQAEARTAFGNADVLIEKYITSPRHIEVQVFGDGRKAVHLFERDCSLQRRHQKVIEEAPAPGMTEEVRAAMGAAAVRAAEAIGYAGAGTIEFIVDGADGLRTDGFWFMEMNTRLQVEHPVTEAITGVDLVAWQLHVAAGNPLPVAQEELEVNGHAFEARLYAEDVPAGFLPATGHLAHLAFPDDARIDTGVLTGSEISPWYDPMIAKITVHRSDRAAALRALHSALAQTQVAGLTTNLGFLQRLAAHEGFAAGKVDTGVIARDQEHLCASPDLTLATVGVAALTAHVKPQPHAGFALWDTPFQQVPLSHGGEDLDVWIRAQDAAHDVALGDQVMTFGHAADGWRATDGHIRQALRHGDQVTVFGLDPITFDIPDPLARGGTMAGGDDVQAPMPGLVQSVAVAPGASVSAGDRMIVLEAMKMEHVLRAPRDGIVAEVRVRAGDQVTAGAILVSLEPT